MIFFLSTIALIQCKAQSYAWPAQIQLNSESTWPSCYKLTNHLPMPLTNQQMAFFPDWDTVYMFGGLTMDMFGPWVVSSSHIYKWKPSNPNVKFHPIDTLTPTTPFKSTINAVAVVKNYAYFIGISDAIHVFDIVTESFIENNNLSAPTHSATHGCISTNDTHIFMVGGITGSSSYTIFVPWLQIYDIAENQWYAEKITVVPMRYGWSDQTCIMIENILFVFGGRIYCDYYQGNQCSTDEVWKYNWSDGWTYLGTKYIPTERSIACYHNSNIYIVGGFQTYTEPNTQLHYYTPNPYGHIDVYDVRHNKFMFRFEIDVYDAKRVYAHAIAMTKALFRQDELYIFGGEDKSGDPVSDLIVCNMTAAAHATKSTVNPQIQTTSKTDAPDKTKISTPGPTYPDATFITATRNDIAEPQAVKTSGTSMVVVLLIIIGALILLLCGCGVYMLGTKVKKNRDIQLDYIENIVVEGEGYEDVGEQDYVEGDAAMADGGSLNKLNINY